MAFRFGQQVNVIIDRQQAQEKGRAFEQHQLSQNTGNRDESKPNGTLWSGCFI